ncbi:hypothetical protein GCM10011369_04330 [Neiella marina]|uniref:Uncharacterized protein n=1 Tax=Neiella marina TaxID=508461 RepID=A0A8J2U296_9GAMM|nr:hypothetical protein [Neiella marina]GGA65936.1 hypothetical protein GCM10011369_04330 [Neiella marina]
MFSNPPPSLIHDVSKLAKLFANLRSSKQRFVSPKEAIPNLQLAHNCSQIELISSRLRGIAPRVIQAACQRLEDSYDHPGQGKMRGALRALKHHLKRRSLLEPTR